MLVGRRSRAGDRADFHLLDDFWGWVEDWLATPDCEILDAAKVEPLHQLDKAAMRIGKG